MKTRDFCYWLQGVLEVGEFNGLNEKQLTIIKNHLNMVFIHDIDPSFPESEQVKLTTAHNKDIQVRC